jgi:hypothetical protein
MQLVDSATTTSGETPATGYQAVNPLVFAQQQYYAAAASAAAAAFAYGAAGMGVVPGLVPMDTYYAQMPYVAMANSHPQQQHLPQQQVVHQSAKSGAPQLSPSAQAKPMAPSTYEGMTEVAVPSGEVETAALNGNS